MSPIPASLHGLRPVIFSLELYGWGEVMCLANTMWSPIQTSSSPRLLSGSGHPTEGVGVSRPPENWEC